MLGRKDHQRAIIKVKSHITAEQMRARGTPECQILLNELADRAADMSSDHQGMHAVALKAFAANQALLKLVCNRVFYVEMILPDNAQHPPTVAADIVRMVATKGDRRRQLATDKTIAEIAKQDSQSGA